MYYANNVYLVMMNNYLLSRNIPLRLNKDMEMNKQVQKWLL